MRWAQDTHFTLIEKDKSAVIWELVFFRWGLIYTPINNMDSTFIAGIGETRYARLSLHVLLVAFGATFRKLCAVVFIEESRLAVVEFADSDAASVTLHLLQQTAAALGRGEEDTMHIRACGC
jgi:hypothetical protein